MKIRLAFLILCVFLCTGFTIHAHADSVFNKIKASETIQCGYTEWPQFFNIDANSGEFSGFFYDLWGLIAQELDVAVEWKMPIQWGQVNEAVTTKKVDIFCPGVWPDGGKRRNMLLSDPVFYNALYAYGRIDDQRLQGQSLENLNNNQFKGVAVDGDATEKILRNRFPMAEREMFAPSSMTPEMIMAVVTKKADFIIMDEAEMNAFITNNPDKIVKISDQPVVMKQVQIPLALGEFHLLNALNGILRDLINDGTIQNLIDKHEIDGVVVAKSAIE